MRKRDYPRQILVHDDVWDVRFTRKLEKDTLGLCDPSTNTIYIKQGLSRTETLQTFIHEALHAVEFSADKHIGHRVIGICEGPLASLFSQLARLI